MSTDKLTPAQRRHRDNEALNHHMSELKEVAYRLLDRHPNLGRDVLELTECGQGDFAADCAYGIPEGREFYLAFGGTKDNNDGSISFGVAETRPQVSSQTGRRLPDRKLRINVRGGDGDKCVYEYPEGHEHEVISLVACWNTETNQWEFDDKLPPKRRTRLLGRIANICYKLDDDAISGDDLCH